MQKPPLDPDVADVAPTASVLTCYDERHLVTYLRLLGAAAEGAIGKRSPASRCALIRSASPDRAQRAWETHLARARWMTEHGYRHLLRRGAPY
jgi:hypothetical protein